MTLVNKLSEMRKSSKKNAPADVLKIMQEAAKKLASTDMIKNAIKKDDQLPSFVLNNTLNEEVSSEELLLEGPLVMTFYRGSW